MKFFYQFLIGFDLKCRYHFNSKFLLNNPDSEVDDMALLFLITIPLGYIL